MATEVILPRVDMDMATGRISRWYVDEGATVEKGQPLFEIETDKAAMEIEAPSTGILRKLTPGHESDIPVGSTVGWICAPDETSPLPAETVPPAAPQAATARATEGVEAPTTSPERETAEPSPPKIVAATPLARRLAATYRIPLAAVPGSGPRRRIQARDVELAAKSSVAAPPAPLPAPLRAEEPRTAVLNRSWLRQGEGRPLVLVHGFGAELNTWRLLVASLPTNRPVLAIDLPGHGGSPALAQPSLTGLADAVARTLAAESVSAADLIGHSLGAAVITEVADSAALDIRSLFLMAPAGLGPEINGAFLAGFSRARSERSLAPWLRLLVADERALSPSFIRATARLRENDAIVNAQEDVVRSLFPDGTQCFSIRPALDRLDIPVRVVFGTDDRIIPPHHAYGVPDAVAIHRLRGIGHMPYIENRAMVALLLSHHLQNEGGAA